MVTTAGAADAAANLSANVILANAAMASVAGNVINKGAGAYTLVAASADVNSNTVGLVFLAPGDVPLAFTFPTTAADPTDAAGYGLSRLDSTISSRMGASPLIANLSNLDSTVSSRLGATPLIANLANLDSTVSSRMGIFTLPTNFAALGLSSTGHVLNVDTLQIYTSNTPQSADNNTKLAFLPSATAGAAGGLLIAGSNAPTQFSGFKIGSITAGSSNVNSDVKAINADTTAAAVLALLNGANVVYQGSVTGAASASSLIDSGLTQADNDWWNGRIIIFMGNIALQATNITGFDASLDRLTFTSTTQTPSGSFVII